MKTIKGFKLFRLRKDGSLGSLFINSKAKLPLKQWLKAQSHPTNGFKYRPRWHATNNKEVSHLSLKNRVWCQVSLKGVTKFQRPKNQGGEWLLAQYIKIDKILK